MMTAKHDVIERQGSLPQRRYRTHTFLKLFFDRIRYSSPTIELPGFFTPMIDVCETDTAIVLEVEIPGISPSDFEFSIDGDLIRLRGEKRRMLHSEISSYRRTERCYGIFERILRLPAEASRENVGATYQDGILTITLTKQSADKRMTG